MPGSAPPLAVAVQSPNPLTTREVPSPSVLSFLCSLSVVGFSFLLFPMLFFSSYLSSSILLSPLLYHSSPSLLVSAILNSLFSFGKIGLNFKYAKGMSFHSEKLQDSGTAFYGLLIKTGCRSLCLWPWFKGDGPVSQMNSIVLWGSWIPLSPDSDLSLRCN